MLFLFLFIKAQTFIDSSLNGILNSITPLFTILFGTLLFNQKFTIKTVIGVITGLIGAIGLIITANGGDLSLNAIIYSLPLAGSCYALNLNIIKIYLSHINALITGVVLLLDLYQVYYCYSEQHFLIKLLITRLIKLILCITLLGVIGTGFAVWLLIID